MKFPEKLWKIVNECISGAIGWGMDGDRIFIDYDKFEMEYLGSDSGFKTKNIISFVRQLNLYGFRKCSRYPDVHEFKHPSFIRGRQDLVKLVKRKLGYRASINTEKLEVKLESEDDAPVVTESNLNAPAPSETSTHNIFWNQMQQYCMFYANWMQKNGHLPKKEVQSPNGVPSTSSSASDNSAAQCRFEVPPRNGSKNNVIYVPVPVPAHFLWPTGMQNSRNLASPVSSSSSSDEQSNIASDRTVFKVE